MENFLTMNSENLLENFKILKIKYDNLKKMKLTLNMARGVPCKEQIDLSNSMLDIVNSQSEFTSEEGIDCRNYGGGACGILEARRLFAQLMDVDENDVIVGGNSSLEMMFDAISMFMTHGFRDCAPWIKQGEIKFLCPSPGYDRHFKISEYFGIKMIPIKMTPNGPDMDEVESLLEKDSSIKGMWCVPKFSNPQGIVYSDSTVKRIANLKPKAKDFKVFWDNAYCVHDLTDEPIKIPSLMKECVKNSNQEMPLIFSSFSKITFAGAAISAMACKGQTLQDIKHRYSVKFVGPNKMNQLRHVRFFKNIVGVENHMKKHRTILRKKFDTVINSLKKHFDKNPILSWNNPKGGYFVSVDLTEGCAKRTVELCKNAGLIITNAGATYPYGNDPKDQNLRLAPSVLSCDSLETAMEIFAISAKIAYIEKITQ